MIAMAHISPRELLEKLRARGDVVAVDCGRLTIFPASNHSVPVDWLKKKQRQLICEIAKATNTPALEFLGYSVGNYGPRLAGGVTLQFRCIVTGQELHAIFNACTRRHRTTKHGKAGDPLPKGRFQVGPRSAFFHFWLSTGLPVHRRSDFHDYMGNLRGLFYTASITKGERLDAKTLRPLTVNMPDKFLTTSRQVPDNTQTRLPDKESSKSPQQQGFEPKPTAWQKNHGNTVTRKHGYTTSITPPESQTMEEWLADHAAG